jgi:hypothetical protein
MRNSLWVELQQTSKQSAESSEQQETRSRLTAHSSLTICPRCENPRRITHRVSSNLLTMDVCARCAVAARRLPHGLDGELSVERLASQSAERQAQSEGEGA